MRSMFDQRLNGLERLDDIIALAEVGAQTGNLRDFYDAFRGSDIPFLHETCDGDVQKLFRATVTSLHEIGTSSPAIALGVSQHMASMFAFGIARTILGGDTRSWQMVDALLSEVQSNRFLLANTTSHAGNQKIGASGSSIRKVEEGYLVEGYSTYMSLALEADKVVFLSRSEDGDLLAVISDLKGNPGLKIEQDLLFGDHLALADTRRLVFNNFVAPAEQVIGPDPGLNAFYLVQLICHNLCVASLYLGGAGRMLKEAIAFSHATYLPDGRILSQSEMQQANIGRLGIIYFNSAQLIFASGAALTDLQAAGTLDAGLAASVLSRISATKYVVAQNVEHIASETRKIVGARSFMDGHPIGRINSEIVFGALGPATEKLIELKFGAALLAAETSSSS
jgi:alkylation response protein AidB-like acyl-CoA dehydrogenase